MEGFIKLGTCEDFFEKQCVKVEGKSLCVYLYDNVFHVFENTCPHQGAPLSEGSFKESKVTCPWHAWQFDVVSGELLGNSNVKIKIYETKVDSEQRLWVKI